MNERRDGQTGKSDDQILRDDVMLVPPQTIPKTASLKVRRGAARDLYSSGHALAPQRGLYVQIVRLALAAAGPRLRQTAKLADETL
jgi:hypothetical protein